MDGGLAAAGAARGAGLFAEQAYAEQVYAGPVDAGQAARLERVGRKTKHAKAKPAPAVSAGADGVGAADGGNAYTLGRGLETRQRVALMTRLLYTMRPEVMAAEKSGGPRKCLDWRNNCRRAMAAEVDDAMRR